MKVCIIQQNNFSKGKQFDHYELSSVYSTDPDGLDQFISVYLTAFCEHRTTADLTSFLCGV